MRSFEVGITVFFLAGCSGPRALDFNSWLDDTAVVKVYARGAHVYVSRPSPDQEGASQWQLKSVEADLYDEAGSRIGSQSSQDTWEATDGSKVMGEELSASPAPSLGAVPWTRYAARSSSTPGRFADVTQVRRVFTWGGKAPRSTSGEACDGSEVRVRFGATYYFQRGEGLASRAVAAQATTPKESYAPRHPGSRGMERHPRVELAQRAR